MPIPLHDMVRAVAREPQEVEAELQKMQVYLCRNHSDERLKIELAARHRQRLLTATQQSVSRGLILHTCSGGGVKVCVCVCVLVCVGEPIDCTRNGLATPRTLYM